MDWVTMMYMRRRVWFPVLLLCAVVGCGDKPAGSGPRASFRSIDITGAEYARKLELPDAEGKPRSLGEFKGKVVVVFFGFTQCPDVCPTTMAELSQVKRALGDDGARLQGVFVTLDPERDTGVALKAYVDNFNAGFVGLRGNAEQTQQAAREFKVFFAKAPGKTESSYTIDHTAGSYIFDPQGRIRLFSRHGAGPKALEDDIRTLLRESA
ncbi:MAG TPA: SCO family protein [Burkholderiaceae bacterium]|nr:SCO family protein [Burkholderiaceae bacterium]